MKMKLRNVCENIEILQQIGAKFVNCWITFHTNSYIDLNFETNLVHFQFIVCPQQHHT